MILANLPYVRQTELAFVNTYGFEPALALDGGSDGLDRYRILAGQVPSRLNPGGRLLLEIGQGQQNDIVYLLKQHLPSADISLINDLGGIPRVVTVTIPG